MNRNTILIIINIIYWLASVLTILRVIPQVYKTFKFKKIISISIWSQIFMFTSCVFWIIYCIANIKTLGIGVLIVNSFVGLIHLIMIISIIIVKVKTKNESNYSENSIADNRNLKLRSSLLLIKNEKNKKYTNGFEKFKTYKIKNISNLAQDEKNKLIEANLNNNSTFKIMSIQKNRTILMCDSTKYVISNSILKKVDTELIKNEIM